jgi:hypothetical protein
METKINFIETPNLFGKEEIKKNIKYNQNL